MFNACSRADLRASTALRTSALALAVALFGAACGADQTPIIANDTNLGRDSGALPVADAGADAAAPWLPPGTDASVPGPTNPVPGADGGCGSVSAAAELVRQPVDIIWAIDGSGSMDDHILAVADNLSRFVTSIEQSGASAHIVLDFPLNGTAAPLAVLAATLDPTRYLWVPGDVDSHNAFQILLETYSQYAGFLRPNAPTHFIVVTDDDNRLPWAEFQTQMTALLGHPFFFHAIASPPDNPCQDAANVGPDYFALAQATGGQQVRLCDDWSTIFPVLQAAVVASAPVPCEFPIPAPPNGETLDPNAVQVVSTPTGGAAEQFPRAQDVAACGTARGWYYDNPAAPTKVSLCPSACTAAQQGGAVSVNFGCAPVYVN